MNKVMLIGNVGKEPDIHYYDSDQAMAVLVLATTERGYTLPNGTKVPDKTDWHNVVLYRGLAKIVERYVHKGDKIYVEGKLHYRSYDDKRGIKHYVTEVFADNMELLTPKPQTSINQGSVAESSKPRSEESIEGVSDTAPF